MTKKIKEHFEKVDELFDILQQKIKKVLKMLRLNLFMNCFHSLKMEYVHLLLQWEVARLIIV